MVGESKREDGRNTVEALKQRVGVFKGFSESGLEFKAEIVTPYHTEFHPVLGSFLIVEASADDYLLGRITTFYPVGIMSGDEADEYLARLMRTSRAVPEDIKEAKLRYNVNVKLLGGIRVGVHDKLEYRPSTRTLPHLGAFVGIPSEGVLRFLCSIGVASGTRSVTVGNFALGDIVFDGNATDNYEIFFDIKGLVSRRTYVFAHAGYGKTNLIKFLVTKLYAEKAEPGLLIFDPEGEYAFTDGKGRPGLVDIPELQKKIAVYTDRPVPEKYRRFIGGKIGFDLPQFSPASIIENCVIPEKLENVWANVVRGLQDEEWRRLVDELHKDGYRVEPDTIKDITQSKERTIPQSILNNLVPIVKKLHRSNSRMMDGIMWHLQQGNIVIVDISLLSSTHGRWVAALMLGRIFEQNQRNFVSVTPSKLLNVIAVVEEAQSVLSKQRQETDNIFISWAKEGRKYNLGAIFVTQQPGAISQELLSQADNFFVFHLLSAQDLFTLKNANAHFSDDILASLLNEPIPGNAYFWSAPYQPFVLPMRATNFETYAKEKMVRTIVKVDKTATEEFASQIETLCQEFDKALRESLTTDKRVAIYGNVTLNSEISSEYLAVKMWNVRFNLNDSLSNEAARVYGETLEGGRAVIRTQAILESLARQEIQHYLSEFNGSLYLAFSKKALPTNKLLRQELVALKKDVLDAPQPKGGGLEKFTG